MPPPKRPTTKPTKRPVKVKPPKKDALIRFTTTQRVTARTKTKADGPDGGTDGSVWVLVMPPTWIQYKNRKTISPKIKTAVLKAFQKFKKG